jgi:LysM repeat protein
MKISLRALLFAATVMGIAVVAPTSVEAAPRTHTVAAGQSLWKIAHRYHVSVNALCQENSLKEGDALKAGQVLTIPDGKAKGAGAQPASKPGHKPAPKAETGDKSPRETKPSRSLPPLAKAVPVSATEDAKDRDEQPAPKPTAASRPKQNHSAAKPPPAAPKPAHQLAKNSHKKKVAPKSVASDPKNRRKGSAEAAAKSAPRGSDKPDEGD